MTFSQPKRKQLETDVVNLQIVIKKEPGHYQNQNSHELSKTQKDDKERKRQSMNLQASYQVNADQSDTLIDRFTGSKHTTEHSFERYLKI